MDRFVGVVLAPVKAVINNALIVFKVGQVFLPESARVHFAPGGFKFFRRDVSAINGRVKPALMVRLPSLLTRKPGVVTVVKSFGRTDTKCVTSDVCHPVDGVTTG